MKNSFKIVIFLVVVALATSTTQLALSVRDLKAANHEMVLKDILKDYQIMNLARISRIEKSSVTLDLYKCKGMKQNIIDSIYLRLYVQNELLIKRDSAVIRQRYEALTE